MIYDDEILGRYVDGELAARESAALELAMERDSELAARVSQLRAVSLELRGIFSPVLSEDVPDRLQTAVMATPTDLTTARAARRRLFTGWGLPAFASGTAAAAGLALGLSLAPTGTLAMEGDGRLVARAELATVLQEGLASQPSGRTTIGVTFRARDGRWCRSFEMAAPEAGLAGIACLIDGTWRIEVAAATSPQTGAYAQASASMPQAVRDQITRLAAGEPLDANGERAARDGGWK